MGGLRLRVTDPPGELSEPTGLDYFFMGGQSNMLGQQGNAVLAPTVPEGQGYEYHHPSRSFKHLEEPTGDWNFNAKGNMGAAFGIAYYDLTGRAAVLHNRAIGGTCQIWEAKGVGTAWDTTIDPDGSMYTLAVAEIDHAVLGASPDMQELADSLGLPWRFGGILWDQGGQEAIEIDNGNAAVTTVRYKEALAAMIASFRTRYAAITPNLPFFIIRLGRRADGESAGWAGIRARQEEVVAEDPHTYFAYEDTINFQTYGWMPDQFHYNQAGYNAMGPDAAEVVAGVLA